MSLADRWEGLSLRLRRGLVLGGAVAVLMALASLLVSAPTDERGGGADERKRLITNLLTDADPRAIGIEAWPSGCAGWSPTWTGSRSAWRSLVWARAWTPSAMP